MNRRIQVKEQFVKKVREEEINWIQRSRVEWHKERDKNSKFFHAMASARQRINGITFLRDGDAKFYTQDDISTHILDFFRSLYTEGDWDRPSQDSLHFASIGEDIENWLEREFDEQEVWAMVFCSSCENAQGSDGCPVAFFLALLGSLERRCHVIHERAPL